MNYALEILSKSIKYKNLSGASQQIGMSQSQLSRIIKKIESDLNIQILDRTSKRNSNWTTSAYELVKIYHEHLKSFNHKVQKISLDQTPTNIKLGTLEGIQHIALDFSHKLLVQSPLKKVELDIYDLNELEQLFLTGELDIIFTVREPMRAKYAYLKTIGYQKLIPIHTHKKFNVYSIFEYQSFHLKKIIHTENSSKIFISNSLHLRQLWLKAYGGLGFLPSKIQKNKGSDVDIVVYMIGTPTLPPQLWATFKHFIKE